MAGDVSKEQLTSAVRKEVRTEMDWDAGHEWRYEEHKDTYTPEELVRVTALQEQWKSLGEQGEKEGWLEWSGGYRDGEFEAADNSVHPTRTIRVREHKNTRSRRIKALDEAVEAEVTRRVNKQWKALKEAEQIMAKLANS